MDLAAFEDLLHYIECDISKNQTRLRHPISEKYALKNTPGMNMFVHGEFYERNAGCMQGIDAGMHVICSLHVS